MEIFDSHAHYDDKKFDVDREEVINKVYNDGITKIVNISCDYDTCISSYELSKKYDFIYHSIGLHPYEAEVFDILKLEKIYDKVKDKKLVAVGEIGLDYSNDYVDESVKEKQKFMFIEQIKFAQSHSLPIVVHTRDASHDTYEILKKYTKENDKVLLHCFSPTDELVDLLIERKKYYCAFGGNITYKRKTSFFKYLEMIPMDKIMIETDAPYLPPETRRGTRNDSSNLIYVIDKLSEIKKMSSEEISMITYENAKKFYDII